MRRQGQLEWSSELIKDHVVARYGKQRLADLYARAGDWDEAFARYLQVTDSNQRTRPSSRDDVADTEDVVKRFCTVLYQQGTLGPIELLTWLDKGCRLILGFEEVSLWSSRDLQPVWGRQRDWGPWEPVAGLPFEIPAESDLHRALLDRVGASAAPHERLDDQVEGRCVIAIGVPSRSSDVRVVLMIGRPGHETILSIARHQLTTRIARDFAIAYGHALDVERLRSRMNDRDRFWCLANEITGQLSKGIHGVPETLERQRVNCTAGSAMAA